MIRFSVCIPNYNYARYLEDTLRSVLSQSYPHFEVIVADNASTDDSLDVVASMKDERIRVIRNNYNIGFAPNLDRATATARYEHMLLLSSDDLMLPDALATYAQVLTDLGNDAARAVLTSAVDVIDSQGRLTSVMWQRPQGVFYESLSPEAAANVDWPSQAIKRAAGLDVLRQTLRARETAALFLATCYSRQMYDKVEGYSALYRMCPDAHFLYKVLAQDSLWVYVPKRLFAYRVHNQNQLAGEANSGALKYQVDAYLQTVEIPQEVLNSVGITRKDMAQTFMDRYVLNPGLTSLAVGQWQRAFKCFAFAMASYPGCALVNGKFYALAGLLALGPLGPLVTRPLYTRYKQQIHESRLRAQ